MNERVAVKRRERREQQMQCVSWSTISHSFAHPTRTRGACAEPLGERERWWVIEMILHGHTGNANLCVMFPSLPLLSLGQAP